MEVYVNDFNSLTTKILFEIYKLRNEVFIVEQNCPYQDIDELDIGARHILLFESENLQAYARIISPGILYPEAVIGRVVVKKSARGKGFGKIVMHQAIDTSKQLYKNTGIVISAQSYLLDWYSEMGFKVVGSEYLEDAIPHTKMHLIWS